MLGRVARWLRLLGCDVLYSNTGEDSELLAEALTEDRILLTADRELAMRAKTHGYLIESEGSENRLREIIYEFNIEPVLYGDRCPECNGMVVEVPKESVEEDVPRYTFVTHDKFRRCNECGRVFWEGSHKELAETDLGRLIGDILED